MCALVIIYYFDRRRTHYFSKSVLALCRTELRSNEAPHLQMSGAWTSMFPIVDGRTNAWIVLCLLCLTVSHAGHLIGPVYVDISTAARGSTEINIRLIPHRGFGYSDNQMATFPERSVGRESTVKLCVLFDFNSSFLIFITMISPLRFQFIIFDLDHSDITSSTSIRHLWSGSRRGRFSLRPFRQLLVSLSMMNGTRVGEQVSLRGGCSACVAVASLTWGASPRRRAQLNGAVPRREMDRITNTALSSVEGGGSGTHLFCPSQSLFLICFV
jgi:hypothetical protein